MYQVTLKPGHPRGLYRRSARAFTHEPVLLTAEELTEAITTDPWLVVEAVEAAEDEPTWATGAKELVRHIGTLEDAAAVQAILDWETSTRRRRSVVKAAEAHLKALAEAEPTEPDEKDDR